MTLRQQQVEQGIILNLKFWNVFLYTSVTLMLTTLNQQQL